MFSILIRGIFASVLCIGYSNLFAVNPASVSGSTHTYNIGEYAQGGVIFWLTPDQTHGLVASIVDMSGSTMPWSSHNDVIGATASDLSFGANFTTTGKINSRLIVAKYGVHTSYAAGACAAYSVSVHRTTYADWYLPSQAELGLMMAMQSTINRVSIAHGGAALDDTAVYWCSLESSTTEAWVQNFANAAQYIRPKSLSCTVRAVRAF